MAERGQVGTPEPRGRRGHRAAPAGRGPGAPSHQRDRPGRGLGHSGRVRCVGGRRAGRLTGRTGRHPGPDRGRVPLRQRASPGGGDVRDRGGANRSGPDAAVPGVHCRSGGNGFVRPGVARHHHRGRRAPGCRTSSAGPLEFRCGGGPGSGDGSRGNSTSAGRMVHAVGAGHPGGAVPDGRGHDHPAGAKPALRKADPDPAEPEAWFSRLEGLLVGRHDLPRPERGLVAEPATTPPAAMPIPAPSSAH